MGKTIQRFFQNLFPMSAQNMQKCFQKLENQLSVMYQTQSVLAREISTTKEFCDRLSKKTDNLELGYSKMQVELDRVQSLLHSLEEKMNTSIDRVNFQYSEICEQYDSIQKEINDFTETIRQETNQIAETVGNAKSSIDEMQTGDIFRRIEFLQGKTIFLEQLLQRNTMAIFDQQNNRYYQFVQSVRQMFHRKSVVDYPFVRIGRENDGGYVMVDDFQNKAVAYSIGICDDVSWDMDMANRKLDVYMYDHTIEDIPEKNPRFHFYKIGLAPHSDGPNLMSLTDMLRMNGHEHEKDMILKIDIEGAEWDVLCEIDSPILEKFSQIVFELHGLNAMENEDKIRSALSNLNKTHQLVHVHANNYGSFIQIGGMIMPELLEATYVLRSEYSLEDRCELLPLKEDRINCPYLPDIFLGAWLTE